MRVRVVRENLDRRLEVQDRLVEFLLILQQVAEVVVRLGVVRHQLQRAPVLGDGIVDLALGLVGDAPVEKHIGITLRLGELERLVVLGQRGVRLAGAEQRVALVHQCHHLVGISKLIAFLAIQLDRVEFRQDVIDRFLPVRTANRWRGIKRQRIVRNDRPRNRLLHNRLRIRY